MTSAQTLQGGSTVRRPLPETQEVAKIDRDDIEDGDQLFHAWLDDYLPSGDYEACRTQPTGFLKQLHGVAWREFLSGIAQERRRAWTKHLYGADSTLLYETDFGLS